MRQAQAWGQAPPRLFPVNIDPSPDRA